MDKKHVNKDFNVIIGSFEGTRICELVVFIFYIYQVRNRERKSLV